MSEWKQYYAQKSQKSQGHHYVDGQLGAVGKTLIYFLTIIFGGVPAIKLLNSKILLFYPGRTWTRMGLSPKDIVGIRSNSLVRFSTQN